MKQVKYSYCIDEKGNLVNISSLTDETRHERKWFCLQCGQEMVANLGNKKVWHFSHKADTACDGESYLHKLAKRRIRERFQTAETFPITFVKDVPCSQHQVCLFYSNGCQVNTKISYDLKKWKRGIIYDTCQEEVKVGEFRPDLLLTCSTRSERAPVFIEVYKTHQSEDRKVNSEYRIIETVKLNSEDDIEDIIVNGFVEDQNCCTFNFNPQFPLVRKYDIPISRFVLYRTGKVHVYYADHHEVCCNKLNEKVYSNSLCELNIKKFGVELWGNHDKLNSYESGLIYLIKKGWQIKNCILCKFRKYNEGYGGHICIRYKSLGPKYKHPQQEMAKNCCYYQIDPQKKDYPLSELENIISEVPM